MCIWNPSVADLRCNSGSKAPVNCSQWSQTSPLVISTLLIWQYRSLSRPASNLALRTLRPAVSYVLPPQPGFCAGGRLGWPSLLGHYMDDMLAVYFGSKLCGRLRHVFLKCSQRGRGHNELPRYFVVGGKKKVGIIGHDAGGCCLYSQMNRFAKVVF